MSEIDDYKILKQIGKGGFATVYKAQERKNGKYVAVKMIDKRQIKEAGMVERVRQEVKIHSHLKHPSILELYTFFENDDNVYLVLELCTNGELAKYVKSNGKLPEEEAGGFISGILSGLLYLHKQKILHRDLSLSNLLLDSSMNVKIADFGLATQLKTLQDKHKTMCGTPNYISPEVATRSWHGMEADVWALGCMMYTMLVGQPPFDTSSVRSTLTKVVMTDVKTPNFVSPEAVDLINQLLRKDPRQRIKLVDVPNHPFFRNQTKNLHSQRQRSGRSAVDSGVHTFNSSPIVEDEQLIFKPPVLHYRTSGHQPLSESYLDRKRNSVALQQTADLGNKFTPLPSPSVSSEAFPRTRRPVNPTFKSGEDLIRSACNSHQYGDVIDVRERRRSRSLPCERRQPSLQQQRFCEERLLEGLDKPKQSSMGAPPLNTNRLRKTRQRTRNALVSITDSGEVVLEFIRHIRRGGVKEERVCDVCRITHDGLRIALFSVDERPSLTALPPPIPSNGSDSVYSYESLPEKHWRKYLYACRFVDLVRSKTPKLTLYTSRAKCVLMENSPSADFEVCFYDECGKVLRSSEGIQITDCNGIRFNADTVYDRQNFNDQCLSLFQHFNDSLKYCEKLEQSLTQLESITNTFSCFPVIIGRRPTSSAADSPGQENKPPLTCSRTQRKYHVTVDCLVPSFCEIRKK